MELLFYVVGLSPTEAKVLHFLLKLSAHAAEL